MSLLSFIKNILFPKHCIGCGVYGVYLCSSCKLEIRFVENEVCIVCQKLSDGGFTHLRCKDKNTPDRLISLYAYRGLIKKLIYSAKYKKSFRVLDPLIDMFVKDLKAGSVTFGPDCLVIPIPLHLLKFVKRGFNQANYIARKFSLKTGLNICSDVLVRIVNNPSQISLGRAERQKNTKNIFKVLPSKREFIKGKDIILVDDVSTSGATMLAASKVLKEAGARYIYCMCLAKD